MSPAPVSDARRIERHSSKTSRVAARGGSLRVPFADHMLAPVPDGVPPERVAAASDNLADAWRSIVPALAERAGGRVLVLGGGARSIGLYAAGLAVAQVVDYVDRDRALRALAPGGACTAVGYYLATGTRVPLMRMHATDATLRVSVSHARAVLRDLLAFIARTGFPAERVTTLAASWDDAPAAYAAHTTKVVLHRDPLLG